MNDDEDRARWVTPPFPVRVRCLPDPTDPTDRGDEEWHYVLGVNMGAQSEGFDAPQMYTTRGSWLPADGYRWYGDTYRREGFIGGEWIDLDEKVSE